MTEKNNQDKEIGSFYMGRQRPPEQSDRVLPKGGLTVVAVLAFVAIVWYAYPDSEQRGGDADVPVIVADKAGYKFTPDDPGGMEVRHQDSTVFEPLEAATAKRVENLLARPEEPVDKDAVLAVKEDVKPAVAEAAAPADLKVEEVAPDTEKFTAKDDAPKVVEKPKAAAVKTDAPKKSAEAAKAEAVKAVAEGVYIQLGSYRDAAGASTDWKKFQQKHPALLGGLTMRTQRVDLGSKGVFNRLQAGKLPETKAKEVCDALKSAGMSACIVVR